MICLFEGVQKWKLGRNIWVTMSYLALFYHKIFVNELLMNECLSYQWLDPTDHCWFRSPLSILLQSKSTTKFQFSVANVPESVGLCLCGTLFCYTMRLLMKIAWKVFRLVSGSFSGNQNMAYRRSSVQCDASFLMCCLLVYCFFYG